MCGVPRAGSHPPEEKGLPQKNPQRQRGRQLSLVRAGPAGRERGAGGQRPCRRRGGNAPLCVLERVHRAGRAWAVREDLLRCGTRLGGVCGPPGGTPEAAGWAGLPRGGPDSEHRASLVRRGDRERLGCQRLRGRRSPRPPHPDPAIPGRPPPAPRLPRVREAPAPLHRPRRLLPGWAALSG